MFFPHKITLPKTTWKVLEIGPGSTPYPRSDAFLELRYEDEAIKLRQRGNVKGIPRFGNRPLYLYDGGSFPFDDNEFDYVICSHVIEHVPNPEKFMSEIFRVGSGRGYIEFPLFPYEYLFDFDVHTNIVQYAEAERCLYYAKKVDLFDSSLRPVRDLLRSSLEQGWTELIDCNKEIFFQGVEFDHPFLIKYESVPSTYLESGAEFKQQGGMRKIINKIMRKSGL
jgi:SAM-dependent methyltransferase